ncbi:integral membrane sensor signal transduction histidine kinase [Candidatus Thiomargarita nelsonii]|uniref:histidine kinase n=1 Tax=Candidatus Thiomargarita nelsonii TaxID=1003181 RepID=A0A176RU84_9GAMM|nr:integral membrane sensor signal transduction histidine kinase [Candidatus Thiomargarita nelsonii]
MTRSKVSLALLEDSTYKQAIDQDLQEMEKLLNELLETERLKGHVVLKRTSSSLNTLVKSVISDYFSDKPIHAFLERSLPTLQLDETRLRLLIRNLLENALKYQPSSAKPVEIHTRKENNAILLIVEDHGAGIEAEHIPHLTDPFYRVDPSRQRKTGGYGLGLYLCRLIAEAHGAQLEISSELGRGTRVSLKISLFAEQR